MLAIPSVARPARPRGAGRVAALAFGVMVLVTAGCTDGLPPASSLDTARTSNSAAPNEQPFIRVTPPPSRPPRLALLRTGGARSSLVQVGLLYNGEWTGPGRRLERVGSADGGSVDWPRPERLENGAPVAIALPGSIPRTLLVRAFDARRHWAGAPTGRPVYERECSLETLVDRRGPCSLQARQDGYALPLGAMTTGGPVRVSVNASWVVPAATAGGDIALVWATWLFAIEPNSAQTGLTARVAV